MSDRDELSRLRADNVRLNRMVSVLMERAEHEQGAHQSDYALFETAAVLEETVKARTAELVEANRRLMDEIARRRSAENELQRAKARAERASENKSSFLTAVSHDLQQPLTAARLLLQAITDRADDDHILDLAAGGQATLETMEALLGSLIDIAKLDSGVVVPQPEHFRLDHLIQRLGQEYRLHAESEGLICRVRCPPAVVYSDPALVERILRNLLGNAVRYTSVGGILLGTRPCGANWHVGVYDTGVGIARSEQERIFRGFYQLPHSRGMGQKGLGLGLTIVRMMAELLEAPITLRSRPNRGSSFGVVLPAGEAARAGTVTVRTGAQPSPTELARHVLLIENDPAVRMGLTSMLTQWGARVEAREHPPADPPPGVDTVIVDLHLGEQVDNGLTYARRLRQSHPHLRLVMVTSERGDWLADACHEQDIALVQKPVETARLRSLLQR